ncbi:MAG: exodeoxyribonuclease VII small subunit [Pirellulaceae bacterium]
MAKRKKAEETPESFEHMLEQLQLVVREIESGKLTLDESLAKYESGVKHLRACFAKLDEVEQKLRLLIDVDDQGVAITRKFEHAASFAENDDEDDDDDIGHRRASQDTVAFDAEDDEDDDAEEDSPAGLF